MRPRFSLRRLLVLTGLFGVLLYVLILRPTSLAKSFGHEREVTAQTDFKSVSEQYFNGMRTDEAVLEVKLQPRSWIHVLRCEQPFSVEMMRPTAEGKLWLACECNFYATPFGVNARRGPILVAKPKPPQM